MNLEKEISKLINNFLYRTLMDEIVIIEEEFDNGPMKFSTEYIEGYLNALENLAAKISHASN